MRSLLSITIVIILLLSLQQYQRKSGKNFLLYIDYLNCETIFERDGINLFWSIKNSNEVLNKFKSKDFKASKSSAYDFSLLYTTIPHHLIKDKLIDII